MTAQMPHELIENSERLVLKQYADAEWVRELIHCDTWQAPESFQEGFEIVGRFPNDPNEDYYQGMAFIAILRRKADGVLFGYPYWQGGGKYGESFIESNGDEHGFECVEANDWASHYVWLPVRPFMITGYEVNQ